MLGNIDTVESASYFPDIFSKSIRNTTWFCITMFSACNVIANNCFNLLYFSLQTIPTLIVHKSFFCSWITCFWLGNWTGIVHTFFCYVISIKFSDF